MTAKNNIFLIYFNNLLVKTYWLDASNIEFELKL